MNKAMDVQFEAWARKMSMDLEYRNIPGVGQFYECPRTLLALEAWQASRAAIEVELLPRVTSEEVAEHLGIDDDTALDISHMINGAIIACGGMIKAAGLKVKP